MKPFAFEGLKQQRYYKNYVTPREWKKGAADMPFGLGAKSLYVNGATGDDSNDGLSWKTAKQKIQSAIDAAGSWTNIFIKAGAYPENVSVELDYIQLLGESRDSVVIKPADDTALAVTGSFCRCQGMSLETNSEYTFTAWIGGAKTIISDMILSPGIPAVHDGILFTGDKCLVDNIKIVNSTMEDGIVFSGADYSEARNCYIELTRPATETYGVEIYMSDDCIVTQNEIKKSEIGVQCSGKTKDNLIFHNNIIDITQDYLRDRTSANHWFENYISGHTNVDNGYGIANEPFSFSGGSDPRPVVMKSGWKGLSMGSAISNILEELELEAIHDSFLFPEDTNETVTFTAGGTIDTFGAWAEIVDNNTITFSSKLTSNDGYISALSIESANTNDMIYLLEIAYGTAKTVVVRHRFKTGVGAIKFELWRQKTLKIPTGETVYYRMKCEAASATATISLRYHFHS